MDYCSIKVTFLAFLPDTRRTFPPESDLTPLLTPPETVFRWGVFGLSAGCAPEEELTVCLWFVRVKRRAQAHRATPPARAPSPAPAAAGLQQPGGSRPPRAALLRGWDMSCRRQVHHSSRSDTNFTAFPPRLGISLDAPVANWSSVHEDRARRTAWAKFHRVTLSI